MGTHLFVYLLFWAAFFLVLFWVISKIEFACRFMEKFKASRGAASSEKEAPAEVFLDSTLPADDDPGAIRHPFPPQEEKTGYFPGTTQFH